MKPKIIALAFLLAAEGAVMAAGAAEKSEPPVPFTEDYLHAAENIAGGETIWKDQCQHCHGAKAYPGKAPKLRPARYKPEFVYRRVADGFRKMPAWKDVYTEEEMMQIVSYILSDQFSP